MWRYAYVKISTPSHKFYCGILFGTSIKYPLGYVHTGHAIGASLPSNIKPQLVHIHSVASVLLNKVLFVI